MTRGPNNFPHDQMPVAVLDPYSGQQRQNDGVLVTVRELDVGVVTVIHCTGQHALEQVCEQLDAMAGDWRVVSLCTPTTIYRDLQGTRKNVWADNVQFPEVQALGRIGRLDLLDPFFEPKIPRGRTHF